MSVHPLLRAPAAGLIILAFSGGCTLQTQLVAENNDRNAAMVAASKSMPVWPAQEPAAPACVITRGLPPEDIARAQAEAKKHILPHWPYIAERSRYVRQRVLAVLGELGAPSELQAVPVIESGYNPYALSHAGAMGLWQLMPRTATWLGVENDRERGGRRDVEQSTEAAIRYLQQLHDQFDSWPLVFAAYHLGPGAVSRRLAHHPWQPGMGIDAMPVPSITRAYVRHVVGFATLMRMNNIRFPEPIATRAVQLNAPVDLRQLEKLAGLKDHEVFRFNPGLNYGQYLNHDVTIHVPARVLSRVEAAARSLKPEFVQVAVRSGDTLWSLSRRHHISLIQLRKLNPDISSHLSIGQRLRVPANQLARARPTGNPLLSHGRRIRYKVRAGDSLWHIARRFGTTPAAIARANQMKPQSLIRPGDTLWILARIHPG
jgi:membrane-bound lytic murein transglycosylase D